MKRRIGPGSAAALVAANMIGAGVFTTSGFALADLGARGPVLAAWAVGGVLALCGALSYAALARRWPESGGEYTFLSRSFHPLAGFVGGWISLLAGFTAPIAVAAHGLEAYLADSFGLGLPARALGSAAILGTALLHGLRLEPGLRWQNAAVGIKLAAMGAFIGLGCARLWGAPGLEPELPSAPAFEAGAFGVTLIWVGFAYSGWNAAVYVAGEVRAPERNLTRALVGATLGVGVLYLALNAVFLYAAPVAALAGRAEVGAVAAEALGGVPLRRALSALVALALLTSVSAMMLVGPRVYQRMAQDGLFPARFAAVSDVPRAAVWLQAALALGVLWVSTLAQLLSYVGFTLGLSAAATVTGLFVVRRREGARAVPAPGFPWAPALFVVVTLASSAFLAMRQPVEALAGLATVASGLPVYAWMRRRQVRESGSASAGS